MKFRRTLWIRLRARSSPAFVLGCLVSVSSMHSLAQPAKDSQDKPPAIIVNVNRVLIPVVVRDKQGRAVGDLKKKTSKSLTKRNRNQSQDSRLRDAGRRKSKPGATQAAASSW